ARSDYIAKHILEVQRAVAEGIPVVAYLCWSITSNREWGLQFDNNSDFGLWHIDLDNDPNLTRIPTAASERYAAIIAARSAAATSTPSRLSSPA
ncbi:MAG: family 1 glycosylhydrolase, partial [Candidatus Eremiobacteraeota bacterium]|nr:family 1 glycosylhydrolase [Candidatus Eremiobacteraeota bacterium]